MIYPTMKDLPFQRLYVEQTTFRHTLVTNVPGVFRGRATAATALWFCEGTLILMCTLEESGLKEESLQPPETVIFHGFMMSTAIRLAISAHDRLIATLQTRIPEDAERAP